MGPKVEMSTGFDVSYEAWGPYVWVWGGRGIGMGAGSDEVEVDDGELDEGGLKRRWTRWLQTDCGMSVTKYSK